MYLLICYVQWRKHTSNSKQATKAKSKRIMIEGNMLLFYIIQRKNFSTLDIHLLLQIIALPRKRLILSNPV